MAQNPMMTSGPETEQAFFADRERFWHAWTRFAVVVASGLVILLILMAVFLV